jgi:hopanoid C-3 methylase
MRVLLVHPSALMYSELFLRIMDLQTHTAAELDRELAQFRPDAVGFSLELPGQRS